MSNTEAEGEVERLKALIGQLLEHPDVEIKSSNILGEMKRAIAYTKHKPGESQHIKNIDNWQDQVVAFHIRNTKHFKSVTDTPFDLEDIKFLSLSLCGETGEVANIIKKIWRGDKNIDDVRHLVEDELSDCLSYLYLLMCAFGTIKVEYAMLRKLGVFVEKMEEASVDMSGLSRHPKG